MQVFSLALPLAALVSGIYAAPGWESAPAADGCLAAVTGKAALGDSGLRAFHCKSFLATTVTPVPVVETVTITADGDYHNGWKRATVAVCPNEVPNYASACDEAHYTSACSVFGFTDILTTTVKPTTTTKTVFVRPTGGVIVSGTTCPAAGTVTKTVSGSGWGGKETVTVTVPSGSATPVTKTITVPVSGSGWGGKETVTVTVPSGSATLVTKTITVSGSAWGGKETVTVTVPVSGSAWGGKETVTVTVPVSGSTWGGKETVTVTAPSGSATLVTKTITVSGAWGSVTATTVTQTVSGTCTTTTTTTTTTSAAASKCVVDDAKASALVSGFITLLEYTDYQPAPNATFPPPGRGYKKEVSDATLDDNFVDISDSINFMAGLPLGGTTFPSKAVFDSPYGQAGQPEVTVQTLNLWHDCDTITWRWAITSTALPVIGINRFSVNPDNGKFIRNYAEFDSGAWLQSFGQQCAINPPQVKGSFDSKRL